jgi:HEAT repeat protein
MHVAWTILLGLLGVACAVPGSGSATATAHDTCVRLTKQLKSDPDEKERAAAGTALGELREDPECAVKALVEAVREDDSYYVPHEALTALGNLGPLAVSAVDGLVLVLKARSDDKPPLDPFLVAEILAKIGPGAIPRLIYHLRASPAVLNDPDQFNYEDKVGTAGTASAALRLIGRDAVQPLIKALSDPERRIDVLLTLGSLGPVAAEAAPALIKLYREDKNVRPAILRALYATGDKVCVARSLYEEVLRSPETKGTDRRQAEAALANLKGCSAEP